jgi:hypothetical protein
VPGQLWKVRSILLRDRKEIWKVRSVLLRVEKEIGKKPNGKPARTYLDVDEK